MSQIIVDCEKLKAVLKSCANIKQLSSAHTYYKLWCKKYDRQIHMGLNSYINETDSWTRGFFIGSLKVYGLIRHKETWTLRQSIN